MAICNTAKPEGQPVQRAKTARALGERLSNAGLGNANFREPVGVIRLA
jgi:hypothetical protein